MSTSRTVSIACRVVRTCRLPSRATSTAGIRSYHNISSTRSIPRQPNTILSLHHIRTYATPTSSPASSSPQTADSILEELQDQYATARDEFEIATEETEKKTVYAADDREAARQEFDALKQMFEDACSGPHGDEVKRRVGQRVRELENALKGLEIAALEE